MLRSLLHPDVSKNRACSKAGQEYWQSLWTSRAELYSGNHLCSLAMQCSGKCVVHSSERDGFVNLEDRIRLKIRNGVGVLGSERRISTFSAVLQSKVEALHMTSIAYTSIIKCKVVNSDGDFFFFL
jgi:hypothetical protein